MNLIQESPVEPLFKIAISDALAERAYFERSARYVASAAEKDNNLKLPQYKNPKGGEEAGLRRLESLLGKRYEKRRVDTRAHQYPRLYPDHKVNYPNEVGKPLVDYTEGSLMDKGPKGRWARVDQIVSEMDSHRNKKFLKNLRKGALIAGGVGAVGYGAKKLYDKHKENKMEKTAGDVLYAAFIDEVIKLAEGKTKQNQVSRAHETAENIGKIIGFSIGAGLGITLGDAAASSISKSNSPVVRDIARVAGGALAGTAALSIMPKINAMAKKVLNMEK
jgi:hypothetical protein